MDQQAVAAPLSASLEGTQLAVDDVVAFVGQQTERSDDTLSFRLVSCRSSSKAQSLLPVLAFSVRSEAARSDLTLTDCLSLA